MQQSLVMMILTTLFQFLITVNVIALCADNHVIRITTDHTAQIEKDAGFAGKCPAFENFCKFKAASECKKSCTQVQEYTNHYCNNEHSTTVVSSSANPATSKTSSKSHVTTQIPVKTTTTLPRTTRATTKQTKATTTTTIAATTHLTKEVVTTNRPTTQEPSTTNGPVTTGTNKGPTATKKLDLDGEVVAHNTECSSIIDNKSYLEAATNCTDAQNATNINSTFCEDFTSCCTKITEAQCNAECNSELKMQCFFLVIFFPHTECIVTTYQFDNVTTTSSTVPATSISTQSTTSSVIHSTPTTTHKSAGSVSARELIVISGLIGIIIANCHL